MGRIILIIGGVLSLSGAIGLYECSDTTIRIYEVLAWPYDSPKLPPKVSISIFTIVSPVLFGVGVMIFNIGLYDVLHQRGANSFPLALLACSGIVTLAAATLINWSLFHQYECFNVFANARSMPVISTLELRMNTAERAANYGWGCLIAAQAMVLIAGIFLPRRQPTAERFRGFSIRNLLLVITVTLPATLFAARQWPAWLVYSFQIRLIEKSHLTPNPAMLGEYATTTTIQLISAASALLVYGAVQTASGAYLSGRASCSIEEE